MTDNKEALEDLEDTMMELECSDNKSRALRNAGHFVVKHVSTLKQALTAQEPVDLEALKRAIRAEKLSIQELKDSAGSASGAGTTCGFNVGIERSLSVIDHFKSRGLIGNVQPFSGAPENGLAGWRPIETALEEGVGYFSEIILYYPEQECGDDWFDEAVRTGWYSPRSYDGDDLWHSHGEELHEERQPTHWMPLPAAPTGEGDE